MNKVKKFKRMALNVMISASVALSATATAFALPEGGGEDPVAGINNLSTLIVSVISAVGGIILLWSVVQLGIAIKKHDPAATSESVLGLVAGLIIACAPWVVNYIMA